jgi:4-hydroxy-tetrahydrodipicolinate synthase
MKINNYPLWTAVITPMLDDGNVDYPTLKILLEEQNKANNGILILGSTGESLNINENERKEIMEFTTNLSLDVPIMAGVGGINLKETLDWVEYLETLKVDCYLMVTPLYAKPGVKGQYEWFKTLMDSVTKPVMLYNIPGRTGISLPIETIKMLENHPNLWAIKEASGSPKDFSEFVKSNTNIRVYSGDDAMLPTYAPLGAKGLVSVSSNIWPSATHEYVEQTLNGTLKDQTLWAECANTLFTASNPIPVKRIMFETGVIKSAKLRLPLIDSDLEDVSPLVDADQKINNWYQQQTNRENEVTI